MKLTRKQELQLIAIGLAYHLDKTLKPTNGEHKRKYVHKWSKSQRAKFMKTWNKKHKK